MNFKNFKEVLDFVEENIKDGRDDTVVLKAEPFLIILREISKLRKDIDKLMGKI